MPEAPAPDMEPDAPVAETVAGDVQVEGGHQPAPLDTSARKPDPEEGITPATDRASIIADIARRRREEGAHDLIGMTDPAIFYGEAARPPAAAAEGDAQGTAEAGGPDEGTGATATEPATAEAASSAAARAPDSDLDRTYTAKVNGREEPVTLRQLLTSYQKDAAASEKMRQAGELLKQAKEASRQATTSQAATPAPAAPAPSADADAPDLKRLLREVQYGDADEVAPEFERYIEQQVERRLGDRLRTSENRIDPIAAAKIAADENEITKGWQDFLKGHPEYQTDTDRAVLLVSKVQREMRADLVNLTSDEEVNEALAQGKTVPQLHALMRLNNLGVRHPNQITQDAHAGISRMFAPSPGAPRPATTAPTSVPREARKATYAQPQPTPRATPTPAPAHAARRDTSDIIAKMRQARGQLVG